MFNLVATALKKLFAKPVKPSKEEIERRNLLHEPDFIDYDGMGNQGRFPKKRK